MRVLYMGCDVTSYISSVTWGGSKSEVARKLELKVINAPTDRNITRLVMELGKSITFYDDNGAELFRGFIIDREFSSVSGTVTYVAYDILYYTLKSTATYNFSGKTAEAITATVCGDVSVPVGSLAPTGISQKLIVQDKSIYDIIMMAYTQAHEQNGKSYRVTASGGCLNVEEMGKVVCTASLNETTNITSSNYTESLSEMVNKVKIYDGEGNPLDVVQNEDVKYGIFQKVYTKEEGKDAVTTAKSMFNGITKSFNLSCINFSGAMTGLGINIIDSALGLNGVAWIESDTHTWSNGVATMSLAVTLKQVMDTKDAGKGSGVESNTQSSGKSSSSSSSASNDMSPADVLDKISVWKGNTPFRNSLTMPKIN